MHRYATESLGSFFLVLALGLAASPLAAGLIYAALYTIGYRISGAHFNPAISFAFALRRDISWPEYLRYAAAQILGAFAAAGIVSYIGSEVFYAEPPADTNAYQQVLVECVFMSLFTLVYLSLAGRSIRKDLASSALIVGLTFAGITMAGQSISGGIYNPALSLGTSVVDYLAIKGGSYEYIPLYVLAPIAGATLAAVCDRYIRR